jgi:hypothetical protein
MKTLVTLHILVVGFSGSAFAQQAVIQQPVIGAMTGSSVVSVPDRGSMLLGGVSSAASGRAIYGPIPHGSSYGASMSSGSMSTHVWIHDQREMDAEVLRNAPQQLTQLQGERRQAALREILRDRDRRTTDPTYAPPRTEMSRAEAIRILRANR